MTICNKEKKKSKRKLEFINICVCISFSISSNNRFCVTTFMMRHTSVRIYRHRAILRLRTQNTLLRWRIAPGCGWLINDFLRKLRIRRLGAETQRQTRTFSRPSTQAAGSAGALTMPSYLNPWRNPDISSSYTIVLVIIELTAVLVRHSRNAIRYTWHILVFSNASI